MQEKKREQKRIEKQLSEIIAKYKFPPELSLARIKKLIYGNGGGDDPRQSFERYLKSVTKHLPEITDARELDRVVTTLIDAWNNFPHKALGNKTPAELRKEGKTQAEVMPVKKGGKKEGEEEQEETPIAEAFLREVYREMFRKQEPFIRWVFEDVLPDYEEYLEARFASNQVIRKHFSIARIFFDQALRVGIRDYEEIPQQFIEQIFPNFWQERIKPLPLKASQVRRSLNNLFDFIFLNYDRFPAMIGDKYHSERCLLESLDKMLPGIAETERQEATIAGEKYTLLEQYCVDPLCDCQKAVISFVNQETKTLTATIAVSWKGEGKRKTPRFFLEPTEQQTREATKLLREAEKYFRENPKLLGTFKRHYALFKGKHF